VLTKNLGGGVHLTRKEIGALLERSGIDATGLRLGYFLMRAELDALICSGARRGKQQTYALLEERAPDARTIDRDEALGELTRRYFTSRGPATVKDYARWSSLTISDCKKAVEIVGAELERSVIGDRTYWFAPFALPAKRRVKVVDLVQVYDECLMGYSESRDVLAGDAPAPENPYMHVVLLDGKPIGRWKRIETRAGVEIETALDRPMDGAETRALERAVERFGRFVGLPAVLR
jgi:hypothetical protein